MYLRIYRFLRCLTALMKCSKNHFTRAGFYTLQLLKLSTSFPSAIVGEEDVKSSCPTCRYPAPPFLP